MGVSLIPSLNLNEQPSQMAHGRMAATPPAAYHALRAHDTSQLGSLFSIFAPVFSIHPLQILLTPGLP